MICCTTLWWDGAGKGRGWKTAAIVYWWQQQHVRGRTAQLSDISSGVTCVADLDSRALALTKEASGNSRALCPCRLKNQIAEHVLQTMSQIQHAEEDTGQWRPPCRHVPDKHAEEDTGQWRPPCRHVPDKHAEEDTGQWRPPCRHVPDKHAEEDTGQWRPPCRHVPDKHAEEDTGQWRPPCRHVPDTTCWRRHWPVETSLQTCPRYNMLKKTLASGDLPADMSQIQHAEEDTGQWRPPCRHVPDTTCWRRHWPVETSLQTCPMYLLRKIHWPVQTPHESRPSYNMLRRLTGQWRPPPCRPSSTTLGRNWRGQLNSPSRQVCPCAQRMTKSKTLTKLTSK